MRLACHQFLCGVVALLLGCFAACSRPDTDVVSKERSIPVTIKIRSAGFAEGQAIPSKYTCDGQDVSPPLSWDNAPNGTQSLALICDDPDAPSGTWVHWVIYDLSATLSELPEAVPAKEEALNGAKQGRNDFGRTGYGGPCPPAGSAHRYYFKLYALDSALNLKAGATKADVEKAMKGHIVGQGQLMGTYKRK